MKEFIVKEMMEQIHIPEEMMEQIITNLQNQMETGKSRARRWKRLVPAAAVLVLAAGIASVPVKAIVHNLVQERMEDIPREEVEDIEDMIRQQTTSADIFSRTYSDREKERNKELWRLYGEGMFPDRSIQLVDSPEEVTEGTLCYIRSTGEFHLPDREMTDEELLEIIDFQHKMSYAVSQGAAAQEAKAEMEAEQAALREQVQAAGGIGGEKALEIAMDYLESEIGDMAEQMILEQAKLESDGNIIRYFIVYRYTGGSLRYFIEIDSADGSISRVQTLGEAGKQGSGGE